VNLELSQHEARLVMQRLLYGQIHEHDTGHFNKLFLRLAEFVHLSLESDGPKGTTVPGTGPRQAELLPGAVPAGRPQGSDQPERTPQSTESVRWATGKYDREAVEQITLTPSKIERKEAATGPFLSVSWQNRHGRGYLSASCFDEALFAWVSGRIKQESVFYVVHKGKYTNIVGVKA
jgi:hypothetical protein